MVVPLFIQSALNNDVITIYDDGSQSRVFCHVEDAIRAVITLSETDSTIGDYFNIGGVGEITIKALAAKIIAQTESKSTVEYIPYAKAYPLGFEDMQRRVPDISKVKKAINWEPRYTLESIITSITENLSSNT
jgi:UDP-glucose 4-epimerase